MDRYCWNLLGKSPFLSRFGAAAVKKEVSASYDSWPTGFVLKRLDVPISGPVGSEHVIGIFTKDDRVRLDIGAGTMKAEFPASHNSWATRLGIVPLDVDIFQNMTDDISMTYGTVVGIFAEDRPVRLDIGMDAVKAEIPALYESWATRLTISPL